MEPYTYTKEKSLPFWEQYRNNILSFLLALFALPVSFYYYVGTTLDASWVRAMNLAIKGNMQFGTAIVFPYGPLAYLSTRNTQYIHDIYLLLSDVFLFGCFYYVIHKILTVNRNWFLIILAAIFYFKGYEYAATVFLFFVVFAILNLKNDFKNYFEVICCAICGVVVFFVKVNYGLVSLPIVLSLSVISLITNRKSFLVFSATAVLAFSIICAKVNIDVINYIKYSLPMISSYNEAMLVAIDPGATPFISAMVYFAIFIPLILFYIFSQQNQKKYVTVYSSLLLFLMAFLAYKNGFTRADGHTEGFFILLPLFMVFALFLLGFGTSIYARVLCVLIIFIADLNITLPHGSEGQGFINRVTVFYTENYFKTIFEKQVDTGNKELRIPEEKLKIIGKSTIDIFPIDVSIIQLNNLNYNPRPIFQSYAAYNPILDSLNANHFYQLDRPEYVMLKMGYIDNRYVAWDEPLTHAMLRLNYDYVDHISLNKDTGLVNTDASYLLLRSKPGVRKYPKFEKVFERTINFEDTIHFDFKDDTPIYMSVNIESGIGGKIKSVLYQAPMIYVSLFLDHACTSSLYYEAIRPIIKAPVAISNFICDNTDYRTFITGNANKNAQVKAFAFHAKGWGYNKKIKLSFYKFSNYK